MSQQVPQITFKTRVRDASVEGPNPFRWEDVTSDEIFNNKKVVVFALQAHLHQPVPALTCPVTKNTTRNYVMPA